MKKILLVEDNEAIAKGLIYSLNQAGFETILSETFSKTKEILKCNDFDLAILDIILPDGNGFDICKYIKSNYIIPIIILSAKDEEKDVILGFDLGAEDYVIKPFRTGELISRINRILRHEDIIEYKNIRIELDSNKVFKDNTLIQFTALEYKILITLFSNINRVITRERLLDRIFDLTGSFVNDNTLTVYIKRIREKLGTNDITTIKGIGYRVEK
ncbi:MAG: response regulator transcription factor [Clostridium sp.]|nr:response regulator transcription factor [Clostridium sp.]MCM1444419.1 response regulator transcription factor [Candidatus Amulumruptor caecigallinarius]